MTKEQAKQKLREKIFNATAFLEELQREGRLKRRGKPATLAEIRKWREACAEDTSRFIDAAWRSFDEPLGEPTEDAPADPDGGGTYGSDGDAPADPDGGGTYGSDGDAPADPDGDTHGSDGDAPADPDGGDTHGSDGDAPADPGGGDTHGSNNGAPADPDGDDEPTENAPNDGES